MYSKDYLSARIAHVKSEIRKLSHGTYGSSRGRNVIYLSYSPSDPRISWKNSRRYFLNTARGIKYSAEVDKSNVLRKELDDLYSEWHVSYKGEPYKMNKPLKRTTGKLNYEYFLKTIGGQNTGDYSETIEYKGIGFRSKNEVLAAQVLDKLKVEYKVEPKLTLDGKTLYPDFLIGAAEVDKSAYVEIYGMMDDHDYVDNNARKNARYLKAGLRQGRDYIPFFTGDSKTFDVIAFEMQIKAWLELAAEEIVREAAGDLEKT